MKLQYTIVIAAILVGSIATVNMAFTTSDSDFSANSVKSSAGMLGHVTLTATNEDGSIIAYRQTDNVVINAGDNCLLEDTFGVATTCFNTTNPYDDIHIGEATAAFGEASTGLGTFHSTTAGTVGTPTLASGSNGASVTVTADFVNVSAAIAEAALRNGPETTTASDVLALQSFSAINLGPTDDLSIEWTVTIDGN